MSNSLITLAPVLVFGLMGGLSTVFGKMAFSSDNLVVLSVLEHCAWATTGSAHCGLVSYVFRLMNFGAIFLCNAIGLGYYLKALEQNNTIVVVILSSAMNFLITGVMGKLIFDEVLSQYWYLGSACVMIGMWLVALSQGNMADRKE